MELLKWLPHAFDSFIDDERIRSIDFYPQDLRSKIDDITPWLTSLICSGVYKAGFNPTQEGYNEHVVPLFAALNKLEKLIHNNGGPYILGEKLTELDLLAYPTVVRFDTVYVQHFKTNLGTIRHDYPVLNNWLKNLYHGVEGFRESTDFQHIKENVSAQLRNDVGHVLTRSSIRRATKISTLSRLRPWGHIRRSRRGTKTTGVD